MDSKFDYSEAIFDAMLSIACKEVMAQRIAELPNESEINHTFSPDFEKRMEKLIRQQARPVRKQKTKRYISRFAAALVILMAIGFSAIMSVSALRIEVLNTLIEFGENYLGFRFGAPETVEPSNNVPYPSYIPEGFNEESTKVLGNITDINFMNEGNVIITYSATLKSGSVAINIDNEYAQPQEVIVNSTAFTIMDGTDNGHACYVIWESDTHLYMVFGEYDVNELLAMATSTIG